MNCNCVGFWNVNCCMRKQWDCTVIKNGQVTIKDDDIIKGELDFLRKELLKTNERLEALFLELKTYKEVNSEFNCLKNKELQELEIKFDRLSESAND